MRLVISIVAAMLSGSLYAQQPVQDPQKVIEQLSTQLEVAVRQRNLAQNEVMSVTAQASARIAELEKQLKEMQAKLAVRKQEGSERAGSK